MFPNLQAEEKMYCIRLKNTGASLKKNIKKKTTYNDIMAFVHFDL